MKQKKLGLTLGSGAARGFAHLGVLQALEEKGIRIDFISGCSIGALIGALYCSGMTVMEIIDLAGMEPWSGLIFRFPKGLVQGRNWSSLLKTHRAKISRTWRNPLQCCYRPVHGERVVLTKDMFIKR